MQIEPKSLTISQAASFLGVSKDTLRRWEKSGLILPARTSGGVRRYSWKDLKAARFQSGRRLYRMSELLEKNRHTVKTIILTSLVWVITITLFVILKPKFLSPTSSAQSVYSDQIKSQNPDKIVYPDERRAR